MFFVRWRRGEDRVGRTFASANLTPVQGVEFRCPACEELFGVGEPVTLVVLGPGDDQENWAKHREGAWYNAVAIQVHFKCLGGDPEKWENLGELQIIAEPRPRASTRSETRRLTIQQAVEEGPVIWFCTPAPDNICLQGGCIYCKQGPEANTAGKWFTPEELVVYVLDSDQEADYARGVKNSYAGYFRKEEEADGSGT